MEPSAVSTGNEKRVRQWGDQKRKLVKSPFTPGIRKSRKDSEVSAAKPTGMKILKRDMILL